MFCLTDGYGWVTGVGAVLLPVNFSMRLGEARQIRSFQMQTAIYKTYKLSRASPVYLSEIGSVCEQAYVRAVGRSYRPPWY